MQLQTKVRDNARGDEFGIQFTSLAKVAAPAYSTQQGTSVYAAPPHEDEWATRATPINVIFAYIHWREE